MMKPLTQGAAELSPSCKEAARLQSLALDHPLRPRQRIGLRIHLILCKWCRRYGRQIRFIRAAALKHGKHEPGLPPQSLRPEAREGIKRRLLEEGK